jgi:hypothetical protein
VRAGEGGEEQRVTGLGDVDVEVGTKRRHDVRRHGHLADAGIGLRPPDDLELRNRQRLDLTFATKDAGTPDPAGVVPRQQPLLLRLPEDAAEQRIDMGSLRRVARIHRRVPGAHVGARIVRS